MVLSVGFVAIRMMMRITVTRTTILRVGSVSRDHTVYRAVVRLGFPYLPAHVDDTFR